MSEQRKDEKWLDGELRRAINTTRPEFDADAWKQKHAKEYEALVARGQEVSRRPEARGRVARAVWIGPVGRLAAAAVIVLAAVFFLSRKSDGPGMVGPGPQPADQPPAKMMTMMSLSTAFRRGGMEALEKQFETASGKLGPRPDGISMAELYRDLES